MGLPTSGSIFTPALLSTGTWKLRVQDAAAADSGYLNTWTITT
ncbi:proprotein convertase P-domain-containing protein [Dactylosporangium matsuzakiense]|nr:proprotein convertase P-domain-containing protein [Dactylosporangium matsuzakiense]UWZ48651.1 proprotein convertase P-domain-containing protein [Dactylosporangium matsuzakiense]